MAVIAVLMCDAVGRARLQSMLRGEAEVRCCTSGPALLELVEGGNVTAAIVETRDASGATMLPAVRLLRARHPAIAIGVYIELTAAAVHDAFIMAQEGAHAIVIRSVDDTWAGVREVLRMAQASNAATHILRVVVSAVPHSLQPFFRFCAMNAGRPITLPIAAAALGVHRRTLLGRLKASGLPAPRCAIGWNRLLHAAWAMRDPEVTAEQVANTLEFASASAMTGMSRRYTGMSSSEIRARGGFPYVLSLFEQVLLLAGGGAETDTS